LSVVAVPAANATLPEWLQHIVGSSTIEAALYRTMQLPALQALYARPPKEAQTELSRLISTVPGDAELYELRARADEQALDETAAETDWKAYAAKAKDPIPAKLELADFYQRRLLIPQEIAVLNDVAAAPNPPAEEYIDPEHQRAWRAYERILWSIQQQGLPPAQTAATFDRFLSRYPDQPAVYAAALNFQLDQKDFVAAQALIPRYRTHFPKDEVFPVRAQALIDYRRGNIDAALAVYDHAFQPLWPADLIQSWFALLDQTHRQRAMVAEARSRLDAHPDGPEALNALARIFYYDQQAGRLDSAQRTLDAFRTAREARHAAWSPNDLYTLATLTEATRSWAEAARYNYALSSVEGTLPNGEPAAQSGLAALVHILLAAPDQNLTLGAQNLSLYRDIATLDQGPGYWNGILSLWLNGTRPQSEYTAENAKAQSYFHRAKAADLLGELDKRFPNAPRRPALHAELLQALAQYGEPALVVTNGKAFLADFPNAPERLDVANLMADAYARQNDTASEFALYDAQLAELATQSNGLPLTAASNSPAPEPPYGMVEGEAVVRVQDPDSVDANAAPVRTLKSQSLAPLPTRKSLPAATAYASVLDRYLGRLTAIGEIPRALTVLRRQLDRNPNDPLLYERLATFLDQNNLSAQQEQVFQQAIAKFQQPTYYDKLARFYLRQRESSAFSDLTRKVTDIFSGTDLDTYFRNVSPGRPLGPELALQLNLYAAKRFPHDLVFTENLLRAYQSIDINDKIAYEALLRRSWWQSPELTTEFLGFLSRTGKLQTELQELGAPSLPTASSSVRVGSTSTNPAALREQAEIQIFISHFEAAAPLLGQVADQYPADPDTGDTAISLYRSLAYLDPTPASTQRAVALESNLLRAAPDSPDRLATLGDLYAEATSTGGEDLTAARPYWERIPELHPGSTQGFLTTSTIFWDYFQFDSALQVVSSARTRFHSPTIFGYEAGAIDENRHDLPTAVAEYTAAFTQPIPIQRHFDSGFGAINAWLAPPSDAGDSNFRATEQSFFGSENSHARLLQLATRASTRAVVDAATSRAVAQNPANSAALTLRADILAAQHHAPELAPLLTQLFNQALDRTSTLDEAATVGTLAQARNLTAVYERALAKQATITLDPVQKIQLQYSLAASLESHDDTSGAARIYDAVYHANPRILGVVRATTDFYARAKQPSRAIATLLEASKAATPTLAHDFTLEAASRANDSGDTAQARTLALTLLPANPYDARVLDAIATSYARANNNAGLRQFYLAQIDAAKAVPGIPRDQRKQNVALLRRGLIPALTRLNDFPAALDQYIALISAFPEDSSTAQEAALYALKHSIQPALLTFYRTTIKQSPQDSRFPILLAQTETTFEDLPAAEAAYSLAIAIRKDRVDVYSARADIELRLSQSDPAQSDLAAADFNRLYLLSYHDPQWMVRLAELRARQQRPADAVQALKTAWIDGHAASPDDAFKVADQLAQWNLLNEARTFAEQGVTLAGASLLTPPGFNQWSREPSGATIYARILTRLGHADSALATLTAARKQADLAATSPTVLAAEIARQNISSDEAQSFRANFAQTQRQTADQNLKSAVEAIGKSIQTYDTPEQKLAFAQTLDTLHATNPTLALTAASAAGLADREADWRKQFLLNWNRHDASEQLAAYTQLQQHRLQFADLGKTLEAYALMLPNGQKPAIRIDAARAYRDAGDLTNETRLDRSLTLAGNADLRDRYFDVLLHHDRASLVALAGSARTELANAALNYITSHATLQQALDAVTRRSQSLPASSGSVWRPAIASLVETSFASPKSKPVVATDFSQSLASNQTIGDRIGAHPDPKKQLTGETFFFYASRFGIYLATVPPSEANPPSEDFLPAELEQSPTSPTPYLNLARTYAEANQIPAALAEYRHALELVPAIPNSPAIEDEIATVLYRAGQKDEAQQHWHTALATLAQMQQKAIYPEAWFTSLKTILQHLGERRLTAAYTPEVETILGPYLAKNGTYRSNELLKAVYQASANPTDGTNLILALAAHAPFPSAVLGGLLPDYSGHSWLPTSATETVLSRCLALDEANPTDSYAIDYSRGKLLQLYLDNNENTKAENLLTSLPERERTKADFAEASILLAARAGHLEALLASYRNTPETAPTSDTLTSVAHTLARQSKPDFGDARLIREFVFDQNQLNHSLAPTDFLSLAQSRLDTGDLPGALTLLRRLTLQPPAQSARYSMETPPTAETNTDSAARLLEAAHHPAEAIPFLEILAKSVPWDASYKLRLAEAQSKVDQPDSKFMWSLDSIARDPSAPYATRLKAAADLAQLSPSATFGAGNLGSKELDFIAHPTTPTDTSQPYFVEARIAAAALATTPDATKQTLLREAIAIAPDAAVANRARLTLLLAQPTTAEPSTLLAIYNSLPANQYNYASNSADQEFEPDEASDSTASVDLTDAQHISLHVLAQSLDRPTQIRLATLLSTAEERCSDCSDALKNALGYAQLAVDLAKASPQPALTRRRDALKAAIALDARNASRFPVFDGTLTQPNQVRPRLTAANLAKEAIQ
jgi:tetratricopeptide (TPR) repeat protein